MSTKHSITASTVPPLLSGRAESFPWINPQQRKGLAFVFLLSALFAAYLIVRPGPAHAITFVDNLSQTLLEGIGLLLALPIGLFGGKDRHAQDHSPGKGLWKRGARWVPLLLSLTILSYVLGQAIWTLNENILHLKVLFPTWADAGYLGSYPFLLAAVLLLPARWLCWRQRVRILLDGLILMIGVCTLSWYFVLGPTYAQSADSLLARLISVAYPVTTLMVTACLVVLMSRYRDEQLRSTFLLLTLALLAITVTDWIYNCQILYGRYMTGTLLDVGWPLGYMLVGLSARSLRLSPAVPNDIAMHDATAGATIKGYIAQPSIWQRLLLPVVVLMAILLLLWAELVRDVAVLTPGVAVGVAVLLGLLVLQQAVIYFETSEQNSQLYLAHQELVSKNDDLQRAYKELEKKTELEIAYEQERRVNRLKDQLLLNVNHELRTPLTQLSGHIELLEMFFETLSSQERKTFIERARQGCENLLQLVNSMLETATADSHLPEPKVEPLALKKIVKEVVEEFRPRLDHALTLHIAEEAVVLADPQFSRQVLRNLISNALKYTPTQAPITITAPCRGGCEPPDEQKATQLCFCVRDRGPGIPPEDIPLLFGKFVRLKRDLAGNVRGTGLGLYLSKQLVEKMGGTIWVESSGRAGEGCAFYVRLPAPALAATSPELSALRSMD